MALVFPSNPSVNDTYQVNGRTYVWNGTTWKRVSVEVPDVLPTLTVDNNFSAGGTLHIDSVNNEIGIGTGTPSHQLHLTQDLGVDGNLIVGGTITVPTPAAGTSDTKVATTAFVGDAVSTAVSGLLDGAPAALDTLNELAAALDDDASYASTITTALAGKLDSSSYTAADVLAKLITVDGTGSSLDADTLDGSHASAFAASSHTHSYAATSHTHSYLPLTGGTVTGQTTFSAVDGVKITGSSGGIWFDDRNGDGSKYVLYHNGGMIGFWDGVTTHHQFHDDGHVSITDGGDNNYIYFGPNATWGGQLYVGATTDKAGTNTAAVISTDGNLHLDVGDSKTMYLNYYTQGRPIWMYGDLNMNGYSISLGSGSSAKSFASGSNYWRPQDAYGNSYFDIQSGQFYVDSDIYYFRNRASTNSMTINSSGDVYIRGKLDISGRIYPDNWIQFDEHEGLYSPLNAAHFYPNNGSYGSWKVDGSRSNWRGIEFGGAGSNSAEAWSFMMTAAGNNYTGVHRNGVGWMWYFNYQDLYCNSYRGFNNVAGTGNASYHPSGIYSTGTNWLYGQIITNNNSINAGSGVITCGEINQNGGTVNDLYGETKFRYVSTSNDWSAQPVQEISSQDCGYACRSFNSDTHTGQLRAASGTWYARSHNDGSYWTVAAVIANQSSRHLKQDIETWGVSKPLSSAVNTAYETTATDLLNKLRVVSYRWKKQDALPADIPSERRSDALDRLNRIRRAQGLDQYDGDEAVHRCGRDCDASEENPCDMYRNWERGTLGLVAEEVGEVIPEVTNIDLYQHSSTKGQNTAIDGLALTSMCVKAIQELSARNAELEERLSQLEAINA